ncbi:MAG: glycosyltransferase [Romboutsia timonensis]|uniref:glycosyltransferase n=1 Tax=Romboutsia timonensis TaxID=1776391 RepID=UPI002A748FAA|nr:glycosyltransferase [Romboutsia timonensis]MDY3000932.1 glycosyltransferase [Romboutsia timonensis]
MPILSIIVPVYNVEKYLRRCLDSLINQHLKEIEIILIDDGSTDRSGIICDEYRKKDNRIFVIHKENGGLSDARNMGLDIAKGMYIAFVDSDDFISVNMFDTLVNEACKNDVEICACGHYKVYDNTIIKEDNNVTNIKIFNNIEALENYLGGYGKDREILTVVWDKIYKKELFDDIRFPIGKIYEDGYVTYKLLYKAKKIAYVNSRLYYYYQREGSLIRSDLSLKTLKSYDDCREIFIFINEKAPLLSNRAAEKYIRKHILTYKQIIENNDKKKEFKIYMHKIKSDLREDFNKLIKLDLCKELKISLILFLINYRLFNILFNIYKYSRGFIRKFKS